MSSTLIVTVIVLYFALLVGISFLTSKKATNDSFFFGERKSPWYLVSFGMIGASLSGVTFLSIPGWVGNASNQFSYMQMAFGYFFGYLIVAYVLLPLYYRLNLTSIYEYLEQRFGFWSYKTGAFFFLISRLVGSSIRLLLVANVLQAILFKDWGIPFEVTVVISVVLIWIYTSRGGIKTIVWTDTLQTLFMLLSVFLTVYLISHALDLPPNKGIVGAIAESQYSKIFFFDDFNSSNHFIKHFLGGVFITIGMTGLDQDMMQKNLSCRNIGDAQKNMITMASVLVFVNLIFLGLGALLYMYAAQHSEIEYASSDLLFSSIAMSDGMGPLVGVLFLLGLIAAAYSSADSALTALTTSFSVDFLNIKKKPKERQEGLRKKVHIGMSIVVILTILLLKEYTNSSAIDLLMKFAGFTYGPLIGLFFFGILTKRSLRDKSVPFISLFSTILTVILWYFSCGSPGVEKGQPGIFGMYIFGFEIILLNAIIIFLSLFFFSKRDGQVQSLEV